jgi:hypothetical protein
MIVAIFHDYSRKLSMITSGFSRHPVLIAAFSPSHDSHFFDDCSRFSMSNYSRFPKSGAISVVIIAMIIAVVQFHAGIQLIHNYGRYFHDYHSVGGIILMINDRSCA